MAGHARQLSRIAAVRTTTVPIVPRLARIRSDLIGWRKSLGWLP
jgi:hypothetical protein